MYAYNVYCYYFVRKCQNITKIKIIQLTGTETYEGHIKTHSNYVQTVVVSDYTALFIVPFSTHKNSCIYEQKTKYDSVAARYTACFTYLYNGMAH